VCHVRLPPVTSPGPILTRRTPTAHTVTFVFSSLLISLCGAQVSIVQRQLAEGSGVASGPGVGTGGSAPGTPVAGGISELESDFRLPAPMRAVFGTGTAATHAPASGEILPALPSRFSTYAAHIFDLVYDSVAVGEGGVWALPTSPGLFSSLLTTVGHDIRRSFERCAGVVGFARWGFFSWRMLLLLLPCFTNWRPFPTLTLVSQRPSLFAVCCARHCTAYPLTTLLRFSVSGCRGLSRSCWHQFCFPTVCLPTANAVGFDFVDI
jgi:hypothetical protein